MRTSGLSILITLALFACWPLEFAAADAEGERAEAAGAERSLEFRRIHAPLDAIEEWPTGGDFYVPVLGKDFEQRLQTLTDRRRQQPAAAGGVSRAIWRGRLEQQTLSGTTEWKVQRPEERTVALSLGSTNMALRRLQWQSRSSAPQSPSAAPTWGADSAGEVTIVVDRDEEIAGEWSRTGELRDDGEIRFSLQLPAAHDQQLLLDLPIEVAPHAAGTLVELVPTAAELAGRRVWRILCGGQTRLELAIRRANSATSTDAAPDFQQSTTYDFSPRGLQVNVELSIRGAAGGDGWLECEIDNSLQPLWARVRQSEVGWSLHPSDRPGKAKLRIELADGRRDVREQVQIRFLAPLPLDEAAALPAVELPESRWRQSSITLLIPRPLLLQRLDLEGCMQTSRESYPGMTAGEVITLQAFAPRPRVEAVVGRVASLPAIAAGVSYTLGRRDVTASMIADCSLTAGEVFQLEAAVGEDWLVETVESEPPGAIANWSQEAAAGGGSRLVVRLERALSAERGHRLMLSGRWRRSPVHSSIRLDDLRFASFAPSCAVETIVRIHADPKLEVALQDVSGSEQRTGDSLTEAEASRLPGTGGTLLQLDASDGADAELQVSEREPRFRADLHVTLLVENETMREQFDIECEPVASDVDRLLVHLSTARDAPIQWFEEQADGPRPLACRKLSETERAALGREADGETWRIELDRPRQSAFHIRGTTRGTLPDRLPATLAAVHGATEQSGTLVIASNASRLPTITNQRLRPLPLRQVAAPNSEPSLARFRYEPESDLNNPRARVTVSRGERLLAESFVWRMLLDSRYSTGGEATHRLRLRVQRGARRQLTLSLSPQARLFSATANGRPLALEPTEGVNTWKIDLAAAAGLVDVAVDFRTSGESLGLSQSLPRPRLELDVPVLDAAWRVWTPLAYEPQRSESVGLAETAGWRKRLFGPAGRAPSAEIFNPLSRRDWSDFAAPDTSLTRASEQALAWLTTLQSQLGDQESVQLAALLTAMPSSETDAVPLRVDLPALDRDGLGPRTRLSVPTEGGSPRRALALLERNGLALIVLPEGLLLTTAARYAEWKPELVELSEGKVAWLSSGAPQFVDQPADGHAWYLSAAAFAKLSSTAAAQPAATEARNEPQELFTYVQTRGWNVTVVPISPTSPTAIQVVRVDYLKMAAWVLWLFVAVLTYWLLPARWVGWIALLAISAAAALLLPEPVSRFATALFLGTLVGLLARWVTRRPWRFAPATSDKTSVLDGSTQRASVVGTAAWLALALAPVDVNAGDPAVAQAAAGERPVYRVFIPTDEEGRPAGDKYFIPQAMFRELFRKPQAAAAHVPAIFRSARYEGKLAWDAARRNLQFDEFSIQWEIRTAGRETIDLPLTPAAFQSAEWEVELNGEAVEPTSDDAGRMRLTLPEAGNHLLSIRGLPPVSEQADRQVATLSIPRIPDAALSLSLPADAPPVHVDSALGASRRTETSGRLTAELGSTDRLAVSWRPSAARGGETIQTNGSQLLSLHVRAGSVVVESQLRLQLGDRALDRMRFSVDPRLRLLPDEAESPRIRQSAHDEPGVIDLEFEEPLTTDQTLRLRFLLTDASGIGRIQLPKLQPLEVRLLDRFLAVYVEENLAFETEISEAVRPITPSSLAPDWGVDVESPPRTAYQLPLGAENWSLMTRPRAARIVGDGRLHIQYGLGETNVHYEAELVSQGGYLFQYQWRVPTALQVHQASVKQDDRELVDRWAVTADGVLTLFLKEAVTGSQNVALSGTLPENKAKGEIPLISLSGAQSTPGAILLYRTSEVALRVEPGERFRTRLDASANPKRDFGVLVATLVPRAEPQLPSTPPPPPGTVVVTPNQPRVVAEQTTVLDRVSNRWRAEIGFDLRIEDGFRDGLRLRLPAAWTEEIEVSPAMQQQVVDAPHGGDQLVLLTPQQPLTGEVDLRLVLRMRASSRDRVHAPNVMLLDADSNARYLLLPKYVDLQPVTWEVEGVRRETLPRRPIDAPLSDDSFWHYRVAAESFDASLKRLERAAGVAQIWLMDVELVVPTDSQPATGLATFDLDPAGLTACRIHVPSQVSLLDLTIDGRPASLRSLDEGMLELNLNSDELTQRIAIAFVTDVDGDDRSTLSVPSLWTEDRPIDVERTLWAVRGMAALQRFESKAPTEPTSQPSAFDLQAERLRSLGLLLSNRAADESSPALMAWLGSWNGWLEQEINRAEWLLEMESKPRRDRASLAEAIASLRRQRDAFRAELEADGVTGDFTSAATPTSRYHPLPMLDHSGFEARAMFHGDVTTLLGRRPAVARTPIPPKTLLACALLAGGLALVWFRKQLDLGDAVQRWAHAWGVVIGLLYWLLLWPSVFGLLIVFVSLLLALLPPWHRVSPPMRR